MTGYRIQRRVGRGSWETQVEDTRATTPGWTDRNVSAGTGYGYRVAAYNYGELGSWSSARSVSTAATPTVPGQATALAAAAGTTSRLELNWAEPGDTGGGVTGYRVERSPDETPRAWATVAADTGSAATRWGDDAVAADTVYHYQVRACNSAGMGPASAEAEGQSRPQLRLPRQVRYPLTAHCEPRSDAAVTATFTAYQPGEAYELTGRTDGWWRVRLLDPAFAEAAWLPTAAGQATGATAALPQPPASPGDFTATLAGGEVTLTWTAPATGTAVTGYRLWRQTDAGAWTQLGSDLAATVLTHTDSTVGNGHVYRYWVQGLAADGPGVRTETEALAVMATVAAPEAVTALTATATTTTLALGWTKAGTGGLPTGYRVAWREADTDDFYWEVVVTGTAYTVTDLIPGTAYDLRVVAYNQEGAAAVTTGTGTTVQAAPGLPTAPAVTVASNTATVTWEAPVAGPAEGGRPDAYHLQSKLSTAGWPATHTTVGTATHSLTGLAYETDYEVQVRASNTAGQSAWVGASFTSGRARPSAVRALAAAPGADSQMVLSWTVPATTAGGIVGYRIERSPDVNPRDWQEQAAAADQTATTWSDSGLAAATVHHYRVTAHNAEGAGEAAEIAGTTRPQAALEAGAAYPLAARAWPLATAPATHTWTAHDAALNLDVAGQATGWYRVVRFGESAGGPYWLPAASVTVTGATTAVPEAPGAPGPLASSAVTHDSATLSWTAPTTGGTVTGYRLWRQTGSAAFAVLGSDLAADALSHTDTTVMGSTTYQYRVQALSAAGAGVRNAAVSVTTAETPRVPGVPTDLAAAPGPDSQMVLTWAAPVDAGTEVISGYRIERAVDAPTLDWRDAEANTGTTDLSWSDSSLTGGTTYHYRVSAHNSVGTGDPSDDTDGTTRPQAALQATATYPLSAHPWPEAGVPATHTWTTHDAAVNLDVVGQGAGGGGWYRVLRFGESASGPYWLPAASVTVTGATTAVPEAPGAPGPLESSAVTHESATLTWTAPATGGTVTGYRLWRREGSGTPAVLGSDLAADVLSHTDSGLTAETEYGYRLQALSAAGAGARTAGTEITTLAVPVTPGRPTDLAAAPGADSQMQLTWRAPASGAAVTGHRIERSRDVNPRDWTDAVVDIAGPATTWSDAGLDAATTYHYRVTARNAAGLGQPSDSDDGTTRPQAALLAAATYPLTAHQWPAATAPVSHTWTAHDAAVKLDVVGQGPGGGGWYRVLRFGQGAAGPYWLPAAAVTVAGATTYLPEAPGVPGELRTTETRGRVVLTWNYPATGGTVTGHRLWRQTGEAAWAVLTDTLDGAAYEYADGDVVIGGTYRYRLQAQSEAGYGPRTVALPVTVLPPPPPDPAYFGGAQTGAAAVDLAWDAVAEATGYEIEIRQSHGDTHVRLPAAGTFSLRTGPEAADTVTVTVAGTGTARRLTGLPAGYTRWEIRLRATNAGGSSYWNPIYVYNNAANLAPAEPAGLGGRRTGAGAVSLSWTAVTGADSYRVYFDFPDDDRGAAGWDWLPWREVTVTVTGATATVGDLPTAAADWGFRVTALNDAFVESLASAPVTVANTG